jgi:hypothetical protein
MEKPKIIECIINNFFLKTETQGTCNLKDSVGTYITFYRKGSDLFDEHFPSLLECLKHNQIEQPTDMNDENTIWLEFFSNKEGGKGFGRKFMDIIKQKALNNNFKYIFLYPSNTLSGNKDYNQEKLIKVYESYNFILLKNCLEPLTNTRVNMFDKWPDETIPPPYHLMYANIANLKTDNDFNNPIEYKKKYLKYKHKYLKIQ